MRESFCQLAAFLLQFFLCAGVSLSNPLNQGLIVRDQSMGEGQGLAVEAGLDPDGAQAHYLITPEMGEARGANLFHSFSQFGIGEGEIATFTGTAGEVLRIIGRVTGSEISQVDGVMRSTVAGADIFLLNPNGVVFSRTAAIDVKGSFAVSTADRLEFSDGVFSVADLGAPWGASGCCGGAPIAYLFAGADPANAGDPAEIRFETGLTAQDYYFAPPVGEELSAVGGVITLESGRVDITDGAVRLAAIGHASVRVPVDLALDGAWHSALGSEAAIRLHASRVSTGLLPNPPSGQGRVVLRGGRLELDNGYIRAGGPAGGGVDLAFSGDIVMTRGSEIIDRSSGPMAGGVRVEAGALLLGESAQIVATGGDIDIRSQGVTRLEDGASIRTVTTYRAANTPVAAGDLRFDVGSLELLSGGQIASLTGSEPWSGPDPQPAGNIDIVVAHGLRIEGIRDDGTSIQRSGILARALSRATAEARGGDITLSAGSIEMARGALVSASSANDAAAGSIAIDAGSSIRLTGGLQAAGEEVTEISSRGNGGGAGNLRLEAPLIEVLEGAAISATSEGAGDAGDITVIADRLRVSGRSTPGIGLVTAQASAIYAEAQAGGSAGRLEVTLQAGLEVSDGGVLSVRTRGSGSAGSAIVNVEGGSIEISSGGLLLSESTATGAGAGAAGSLVLFAAEDIRISEGGALRATAEAVDAGEIRLEAGSDLTLVDGLVTTRSGSALGGNIGLDAGSLVHLVRSRVETDVGGAGNGGNIRLGQGSANVPDPPRFAVLNASRLTATAEVNQGGFIFIAAGQYLESAGSRVDASSGDPEKDGIVELVAPELEVSGDIEILPASYLDVSVLLQEHCAARRGGEGSSLTLEGRPNIAPEPGGYLPASVLAGASVPDPATAGQAPGRASLLSPASLAAFDPKCGGTRGLFGAPGN